MIKEGVQYKVRIDFIVQREIVHGLKYVQKTYRMGLQGKLVIQISRVYGFVSNKLRLKLEHWTGERFRCVCLELSLFQSFYALFLHF